MVAETTAARDELAARVETATTAAEEAPPAPKARRRGQQRRKRCRGRPFRRGPRGAREGCGSGGSRRRDHRDRHRFRRADRGPGRRGSGGDRPRHAETKVTETAGRPRRRGRAAKPRSSSKNAIAAAGQALEDLKAAEAAAAERSVQRSPPKPPQRTPRRAPPPCPPAGGRENGREAGPMPVRRQPTSPPSRPSPCWCLTSRPRPSTSCRPRRAFARRGAPQRLRIRRPLDLSLPTDAQPLAITQP